MTDDQKIMISIIAWGLAAAVFTVLSKKEKTAKRKKVISLIGNFFILLLIFGFALWAGLPWKPLSIFAVLAIGLVFIGKNIRSIARHADTLNNSSFQKVNSVLNVARNTNLRVETAA